MGSSSCTSPTVFNQNKPAVSAKQSSSSKPTLSYPFHDLLAGNMQFLNFQESPRFCQASINCKRLLSRRWIKTTYFCWYFILLMISSAMILDRGWEMIPISITQPYNLHKRSPLEYLAYFLFSYLLPDAWWARHVKYNDR